MEERGKVLLIGETSYVAKGCIDYLKNANYKVQTFGRGDACRNHDSIKGNIYDINENSHFDDEYDFVVNYVVVKDQDVEDNIRYIKKLIDFCKSKHIKKLIHFSSIMVYNYQEKSITETTPIERLDSTYKKGYGEIKIAVDEYLMQVKDDLPFELVLVRPGYVLADDRDCPFIKNLPLGLTLIKGNFKSKQPIVRREDIHTSLAQIMNTAKNNDIYHLFPNNEMTKYKYAKNINSGLIIPMPKCIFKWIPMIFMKLGILSKSIYSRFEGMYIESNFSSSVTEKKLNVKFK